MALYDRLSMYLLRSGLRQHCDSFPPRIRAYSMAGVPLLRGVRGSLHPYHHLPTQKNPLHGDSLLYRLRCRIPSLLHHSPSHQRDQTIS